MASVDGLDISAHYARLQNGSDIRGVALEGVEGQPVTIYTTEAFFIACGFADWLMKNQGKLAEELTVSIGRDPRLSGEAIVQAFVAGLRYSGMGAVDMGLATTPACFMSTKLEGFQYSASLMCTASHLPWNRNGLKFFTESGGLKKPDITYILDSAASHAMEEPTASEAIGKLLANSTIDIMPHYSAHLRRLIQEGVDHPAHYETPLEGLKVIVDAGNGSGGFFADQVLQPLGCDTKGSQFLDPDGNFPNHVPNPEDAEAMHSAAAAVKAAGADLGVVFDTDVDRSGMVDATGLEINKNRLIALLASIVLSDCPGTTVVTDSVTNAGLASFIQAKGGRHLRFKRGYANVISKGIELNEAGEECNLMIETSGHGAMKENYFLDDGAYLAVKIIIAFMRARLAGKSSLADLLDGYTESLEGREVRLGLPVESFKEEGAKVLPKFKELIESQEGWTLEAENFEGWRATIEEGNGKSGWVLLRQSLHDPLLVLNVESDVEGGCKRTIDVVDTWLASKGFNVDASKLRS